MASGTLTIERIKPMTIEQRVATLEQKVSEIEGRQQTQLDATGILSSILTELRTANEQRDEMRSEIGELRTEMQAGFQRMEAVMVRMDERVARLEGDRES